MYQRIENYKEYQRITTVDTDGNYEQKIKWNDGTITNCYKTTIYKMGWKSVKEFLRNRPKFKKILGGN